MADAPLIRQILIEEIFAEQGGTRRTLERVPQDAWEWAPHAKSMKMGRLATWVATGIGHVPGVLTADVLDAASGAPPPVPPPTSAAELVPAFDAGVKAALEALRAAPDSAMGEMWTYRSGDQVIWGPSPRYRVILSFFLADMIHHRAQLGVFLRLRGIPVPSVYGPSADESA